MANYPKKMSQTLGKPPSLFGISGTILVPWLMILAFILLICSIWNITLKIRVILGFAGIITWWLLNGKNNYHFASRLLRMKTPKYRRSRIVYAPLISKKRGGNHG